MVAELPDSDLWGAMMLQELPKVAVAMVSLAMVALLISLARNLMKELVKKEHVERVALAEVEVPELWYSPYGERTHATRTCHGLRNATSVHRVLPCRYCCPNQMRLREQRIVEHRRTFYEAAGKYLWFKLAVIVILMSMSWFMIFEVNETYGFPLARDRMLNYQNNENKNERERKVIAPAEALPAGKSQEGHHTELFTMWSHVHEPNTRTTARTRTTPRTTSRIRSCTPTSTGPKETKEEQSCNYVFENNDVVEYDEKLKSEEVPHLKYLKNFVFELVLEFKEYLAKAGRSLEPVVSYVVRTCHPLLLLLGTPLGMVTWIYLYFWVKVKQTKREKLKNKVSRRRLHRSVCSVLCEKRMWLHLVLLYSHMQCAVAMEEALQRLTELTAQNTQQIQAAMNNQQAQAGTASQQVQELAQSMAQHQRAITEATQATNTALSQQAELTANAVAATGKLTADAVTALSQHAESRRPGEVDLHKMIKSPEVFGPTTYREERDGFLKLDRSPQPRHPQED